MNAQGYKDLKVFQRSYAIAMKIFEYTTSFPAEERFSLVSQIRRSSRSVSANIGEAYRKRMYPKHFISKLSDSDGECTETMIHTDFAKDCGYLTGDQHKLIIDEYLQIGKMLGSMMRHPEKFFPKEKTDDGYLPTASAY